MISGIRMPQTRCTRISESGILRRAALALCACLLFTAVLGGCGAETSDEPVDSSKLQVMASFLYDARFRTKIGGEHVQVTCMVPSGTEPHDWEPSTKDITRMEQADVFIYNGAGMEHWVSDVLAGLSNKKLISVEASQEELLRSAEEEESHDHEAVHADEGEEDSHDHGTAHADEDGHDHADEEDAAVSNAAAHEDDAADHTVVAAPDGHDAHEHGEYDPHVWLDPMNAKQEMQNICEAFSEADPEHRADYQANYEKWAKQLDELDKTYQTTLENLSERNIVVAHEAYGYLCRRYNLTQVSIEGMSPDSEPDPGRMADIIDFVRANNVRAIFFEELSGSRTAETVAAETGVKLFDPQPAGRPKRQTGRNRRRLFFRHGRKSAAADRSFAVRSRHMNAIEIKNLHFSYGKENVLDGVSLCLKEGRLAILAGENGAGKSTLLRLFIRRAPDRGKATKGIKKKAAAMAALRFWGKTSDSLRTGRASAMCRRTGWVAGRIFRHPWKKSCAQIYISRSDCSGLRGKKSGSR